MQPDKHWQLAMHGSMGRDTEEQSITEHCLVNPNGIPVQGELYTKQLSRRMLSNARLLDTWNDKQRLHTVVGPQKTIAASLQHLPASLLTFKPVFKVLQQAPESSVLDTHCRVQDRTMQASLRWNVLDPSAVLKAPATRLSLPISKEGTGLVLSIVVKSYTVSWLCVGFAARHSQIRLVSAQGCEKDGQRAVPFWIRAHPVEGHAIEQTEPASKPLNHTRSAKDVHQNTGGLARVRDAVYLHAGQPYT